MGHVRHVEDEHGNLVEILFCSAGACVSSGCLVGRSRRSGADGGLASTPSVRGPSRAVCAGSRSGAELSESSLSESSLSVYNM
jgi:hypothetical protein